MVSDLVGSAGKPLLIPDLTNSIKSMHACINISFMTNEIPECDL